MVSRRETGGEDGREYTRLLPKSLQEDSLAVDAPTEPKAADTNPLGQRGGPEDQASCLLSHGTYPYLK